MDERALRFSLIMAGLDNRGFWHIYYRSYFVGTIGPYENRWRARMHGVPLGEFESLDTAKRAVAQWYYGPDAE